jgi:hypothetical protein
MLAVVRTAEWLFVQGCIGNILILGNQHGFPTLTRKPTNDPIYSVPATHSLSEDTFSSGGIAVKVHQRSHTRNLQ